MSRPPKLKASFVIPVYNGEAYIAEAIQSCLGQDQKGIEVIVVNDGSTDNTLNVISQIDDKRLKVISLPENRGRSMARNAGILQANSDLMFMLDADDVSAYTRVSDVLNALNKDPRPDILYGNFHVMNELGQIMGVEESKPFDFNVVKTDGRTFIGHSTMCFKREVFDKVQYTDGDYSRNAIDDWRFQVDAHKAGFTFKNVPRILSRYRYIYKKRDEVKIKELKDLCLKS